ncbi:hypothetical protein LCGC14_0203340 [marine sediment metagenome]|uniref:peptidylprolyl isomerase n=1 Tax=marine sediment metagenome TaxID=412755 RepID=A0A0F9UZ76_9ZZZZ|nr:hypothetical protein [Phycisphaerae bacterium]HDZ42880.1 hypothetical protein [Phycisphaerae bacterium]
MNKISTGCRCILLALLVSIGCDGADLTSSEWQWFKSRKKSTPVTPPTYVAPSSDVSPMPPEGDGDGARADAAEGISDEDLSADATLESEEGVIVPWDQLAAAERAAAAPLSGAGATAVEAPPTDPPTPAEAGELLRRRPVGPHEGSLDAGLDRDVDADAEETDKDPAVGSDEVATDIGQLLTDLADDDEGAADDDAGEDAGTDEADVDDAAAEPSSRPDPDDEVDDPTTGPGELVAASMVQINDRFITVDDVLRPLHGRLLTLERPPREEDFRRQVQGLIVSELRRQASETLVLIEAERTMSDGHKELIDKEMDRTLREMIARSGGSKKALERQCRQRHTTLEDLLADQRKRLITRSFLRQKIEPAIVINRRMLLAYYRTHRKEFTEKRKVQMQIIALPVEGFLPDSDEPPTEVDRQLARARARKEIERAAAEIEAGVDFGRVARKYSRGIKRDEGGVWPVLTEGSFRETAVQRNALRIKRGEVCGIIETPSGYYIVKTLRIIRGKTISFEDAQKGIDEKLRDQQYTRRSDEYFKKLLAEATIAESPQFLIDAVDQAVRLYWRRSR